MPTQWTINNAQGGRDSSALVGCKIQLSNDGLHYEFTSPSNVVLATTPGSTLPTVPFNFPLFPIPGGSAVWNWNVLVTTVNAGRQQNKLEGTWTNNDPNPAQDEGGTWTAQAGSGMGEEEDTEDAASASA